ncbi:MAG TPA: polyprenyl synthetase family protein [Polyangiaceae bacterium]|nr:polyprenyl synthetase family protein [Polyangiaceae bacterium]
MSSPLPATVLATDSNRGSAQQISEYMADCRTLVLEQIETMVPRGRRLRPILYDLMLDYPLREAKALRPALCIATCRALGGSLEGVLQSAAVLELYHNAFLIHDDVEDDSEKRRDQPTLHRAHGVPIAVNVGDAMLALALAPLFDNMRLVGLGKALRILKAISEMARHTAEGQALELSWIRAERWQLSNTDYLRMVQKKTSWYTFITPVVIGGLVAGANDAQLSLLRRFAGAVGSAFQIQDDVLNLSADEGRYGKEINGDLWEGKRTLILLHALRHANPRDLERALSILAKPRPSSSSEPTGSSFDQLLSQLADAGELSASALASLRAERQRNVQALDTKTEGDIAFLASLVAEHRSLAYARDIAQRRAARASHMLRELCAVMPASVHRDFLISIVDFVVQRDH